MNRRSILGISAMTALGLALLPGSAIGQKQSLKRQLVGTWALVSWDQTLPDGSKVERFGANPKGEYAFTRNGRFFQMIARPDLPKIASNNAMNPTPEEAKAIAAGSIAYYGTYTVNEKDKTLSFELELTTFTNQLGIEQKRTITSITEDEMHISNSSVVGGGKIETVWKRVK